MDLLENYHQLLYQLDYNISPYKMEEEEDSSRKFQL